MKNVVLLLLFVSINSLEILAQQPDEEEEKIRKVVTELPQFPTSGLIGYNYEKDWIMKNAARDLNWFLLENICYSEEAYANKIAGVVEVRFVVEKDSIITNIELLNDIGGGCGAEALRVVKMISKFVPAKLNNQSVRAQHQIPIKFDATNEYLVKKGNLWIFKGPPPPPLPPPPPPPPVSLDERLAMMPDIMPMFPAEISDKLSSKEQKQRADSMMLKFIYDNLCYPEIALENGVAGTCVVQFVVQEDSTLTDIKVVRDIGAQCGHEALRIVELMPNWIPGEKDGKPIKVQCNLPVKFRLPKE